MTARAGLVGYIRVSTHIQDLQLQRDALDEAGCVRLFEDEMSSRHAVRPGLTAVLDYLRDGDTLIVWKLDRLGRSAKEVLTIAEQLHANGVGLRILTGTLAGHYTPTGEGKFFFTIMAAFAELERDMIRERTIAGLAAARAKGRVGGRRPAMNADRVAAAQARLAKGQSLGEIAEALGVSRTTVWRHVPRPTADVTADSA